MTATHYNWRLDPERRARYERAARLARRTLADWMRVTLDDAAERENTRASLKAKGARP